MAVSTFSSQPSYSSSQCSSNGRPAREQLRPAFECRLVGDRVPTEIDVAVQESALDAEGTRFDEEPCASLVHCDHGVLEQERVEGIEGLCGVQPVLEPEPALLEAPPSLAEDGVAAYISSHPSQSGGIVTSNGLGKPARSAPA